MGKDGLKLVWEYYNSPSVESKVMYTMKVAKIGLKMNPRHHGKLLTVYTIPDLWYYLVWSMCTNSTNSLYDFTALTKVSPSRNVVHILVYRFAVINRNIANQKVQVEYIHE